VTSGGNKFNDFPENQLTKTTDKNDKTVLLVRNRQTNREKRRRQYSVFSTQQILLQEHQAENTGKNGLVGLQLH